MEEDKKKSEEFSLDELVDFIPMNIINDGKQLSIRIPSKVIEALEIDPKKDIFIFSFDRKKLHLEGWLEDKEKWERETENEEEY